MTSPIETNNVVERLRLVRDHTYLADAEAMCEEAADEIEWLRSERQSLSDRIDVLEGAVAQARVDILVTLGAVRDSMSSEGVACFQSIADRLAASLTQGGNTNG